MEAGLLFRHEQHRVAGRMAAAIVITVALLCGALWFGSGGEPEPFPERLKLALGLDVFYLVWLGAAIANVARLRFFSADDIDGSSHGEGSQPVRNGNAVLQNTLEQVVLGIGAQMTLAATLDHARIVLFAVAALFFVGRALFFIGYRRGAGARAFGFALTFYPSMAGLLIAAGAFLAGMWWA